jgi:hypothetical protein
MAQYVGLNLQSLIPESGQKTLVMTICTYGRTSGQNHCGLEAGKGAGTDAYRYRYWRARVTHTKLEVYDDGRLTSARAYERRSGVGRLQLE